MKRYRLSVCKGMDCKGNGSDAVFAAAKEELADRPWSALRGVPGRLLRLLPHGAQRRHPRGHRAQAQPALPRGLPAHGLAGRGLLLAHDAREDAPGGGPSTSPRTSPSASFFGARRRIRSPLAAPMGAAAGTEDGPPGLCGRSMASVEALGAWRHRLGRGPPGLRGAERPWPAPSTTATRSAGLRVRAAPGVSGGASRLRSAGAGR